MKNVKVGQIDDISIVGFDLHVKTPDGKKEVISDGVVSLLKGSLVLEGNDGNPLSRADIFGKTNLQAGSSVLVPEFLSSESGEDEVERKDSSGKEKKEELSDEQLKELKKKMEELKKLKEDLEKQQKELKEKEEKLEEKKGEEEASGEDSEAVEEIIQQLEESIQAMASAATAASQTQEMPAPPPPADDNTSKKKGTSDGTAASSSASAPPVEEEEEETKIFVEVSLASRSDSGDKDDFITNKNAPSFEVKTLPNATITLIINGTTYTAKADSNGNSIINVDELEDGVYVVNVEAMDGSGSTSTVTEVIIDTVPPEATLALGTDSGKFDDDFITNINQPTFVGTLSGDPTEVILDIGELSFIIPAKNGDFTYAVTDVIPDGEYDAILTAIDAAGNETVIKQKIIIDTVNEFGVQLADSSDTGDKGDWETNSLSPTFTFDHEVGATVQIIYNGQLYDDIIVNEMPPSTYTFDPPLGEGVHVLSFVSVDLAGNKSTIEKTLTIDVTPPEFDFRGLTTATDTGNKGDLVTGNTKPFFEGRGEPETKIYLILDGKSFEPVEVDVDGKWFIDLGILEEGPYNFTIYAQDKAGNQSAHVTDTLVIDTTGPVISGGLAASADLGHFSNDGVTSADDLLFEVTTEIGIQVYITIPELGIEEQLLIEDPDGVYTINCENVPIGTYTYSITAVDRAGNPSKNNLTGNILVDRTIENFSANLKATSDSGFDQEDNLTKETLLEVEGTGEAGSKINLSVQQRDENENLIPVFDHGPEYVKEDGTWSFFLPAHLLEGSYLLTFTITDLAGNEKPIDFWVTVDKQASLSAKLFVDADDADSEVDSLDGLTNKPSLEFSGSADAGSRISILLRHPETNEQIVFEDFYADANGNWKAVFSDGQTLTEQGEWVWTISAEDPAGNLATNVSGNFVFDSIPPVASISLSSTPGFDPTHTHDTELDFSVTSEVGSTVQVVVYELINGVANTLNPAYQSNPPVLIPPSGTMSYTLPQLNEGKYVYFVIATDPAGNVTQTVDQYVTIDTTLPPIGDIILTAASDTNIVGDFETYDTTLTFSGSGAEVGTKMNITIKNQETQVYVKPDPQFDITDPSWVFELPELEHGTYVITFQTEDAAGNRSNETQEFTITIDTVKPPLNEVSLESGNVSGNHFVTKEEHPVFIGKADVGDTITISLYVDVDGKRTFWSSKTDVVPEGNGGWRIEFTDTIPDGKYFWTITAIDVAGNVSELTEDDQTLLVDSVYSAGTAALDDSTNSGSKVDNVTNFTSPVISGSGEPHTSVQLTTLTGPGPLFESIDVTGVPIATLNENGEWQLTLPILDKGEGVYTYTVTFTDAAGNSQPVTNTITLDTVTTIEGKLETDTGTLDSDGLTKDSTPTFSGTGEPKADLLLTLIHNATKEQVTVPGKVLDNGTWSITVPDINALSEGEWTWKVTATDLAGNIGYTPEGGITIDTSAPVFTEYGMVDSGAFIPDGEPPSINNPSPNFTGKVTEIGGYVTVVIFPVYGGVPSGNPMHTSPPATAGGEGQFTLPIGTVLDEGEYQWQLVVTDAAGNKTETPKEHFIVDLSRPEFTVDYDDEFSVNQVGGIYYTNDHEFSFSGTAGSPTQSEVGTRINITLSGPSGNITLDPAFATVGADGNWSYTVDPDAAAVILANPGVYTWSFQAQDAAGNTSELSQSGSIKLDITPPVPTFTGLGNDENGDSTDTGNSSTDWLTNADKPVFTGTVDEDATITVILTPTGSGQPIILNVQAVAGQTWQVAPSLTIPVGTYNISITATDNAGNTNDPPLTFEKDLVIDRNVTGGTVDDIGLSTETDSGLKEDETTNSRAPTIHGEVEAGTRVELVSLFAPEQPPDPPQNLVQLGDNYFALASDGEFTLTLPSLVGMPEGEYTYTLKYIDPAGNEDTVTHKFTLDTTIDVTAVFDSDTGTDGTLLYTNEDVVSFSGTGLDGDKVTLTITPPNGAPAFALEAVYVDATNTWRIPNINLSAYGEGVFTWNVAGVDPSGNEDLINAGSFYRDKTPPEEGNISISPAGFESTHTNDTRPAFTITGEIGAKVSISVWYESKDNGEPFTVTDLEIIDVDGKGQLVYTFPSAFTNQGNYVCEVIVTDFAGNSTTYPLETIKIDTSAPSLTTQIELDDAITVGEEDYANDKALSFTGAAGSAEVGTRIYLELFTGEEPNLTPVSGITPPYIEVVNIDGSWTYSLNSAFATTLEDDDYTWRFYSLDSAGNVSEPRITGSFVLDTRAPTPTFTGLGRNPDNSSTDTGSSDTDLITNNQKPIISGTVDEPSMITVTLTRVGGPTITLTTEQPVNGSWSLTPITNLEPGSYTINIIATDNAGNVSSQVTHPDPLVIDRDVVGGDVGSFGLTDATDSGTDENDDITNNPNPVLEGTVEIGTRVEVTSLMGPAGVQLIPTGSNLYVDDADDGSWQISLPSLAGLPEGEYSYTLKYVDVAGNEEFKEFHFIYDVSINIEIDFASESGSDETNIYANVNPVRFSGTGDAGDEIILTLTPLNGSAIVLDPVQVDEDGNWFIDSPILSSQGEYSWSITVTDAAGNRAPAANNLSDPKYNGSFILDTIPPEITEIWLDESSQTGFSSTHTNDTTPTLHVKGEVGAKITIQLWLEGSDPALGHTATDIIIPENGIVNHTFTDALAPGTYKWQVTITDVAGNSVPSQILDFVLDTSLPAAPVVNLNDAVESEEGDIYLNEKTVSFSGTAVGEANSRVELVLTKVGSSTPLEFDPNFATVDASGNWTFTLNSAVASVLDEAEYNWSFIIRDQAGNVSTVATTGSFTVDTIAPEVTFEGLGLGGDGLSTDTGDNASDLVTYADNPVFTGTVTEDATITIRLIKLNANGVATNEVITLTDKVSQGSWSITSAEIIPEGTYRVSITATDPAGNVTDPALVTENPLIIDRNVVGGDVSEIGLHPDSNSGDKTDQTTNEDTVTISGTVEAGATVELTALRLKNPDGTLGPLISLAGGDYTDEADDGSWSITLPSLYGLADGIYQYTVNYTDVAGNQKPVTHEFIRDTSVDITVNFDNATGDSDETFTYCNLDTVTFSGTGTNKDSITITLRGEPGVTLTLDPIIVSGDSWTTPPIDFSQFEQGNIIWTVYATDPSGNVNTDHSGVIFRDTVIPQFESLGLSETTQTGFDPTSTNSLSPTFAIDGEPGAKVTIKLWTGTTATGTPQTINLVLPADGENAGYLEHTFAQALSAGSYVWQVVMTDVAGNVNPSELQNLLIDKTVPTITSSAIDDTTNGHYVNHSPVILSGTGEAHSRVYITLTDTENQQNVVIVPDYVTVDANGNWSFSLELNDGSYSWEIKAIDGAGNESTPVTGNVVKDMQPPTPTFSGLDRLPNDDGIVSDSGTLGDNTTKETRPSFTGTVDELSEITITITSIDGSTEHVITSDGFITGAWTIDYNDGAALTHGDYTVTVTAIDYAGNSTTIPADGDPVFDLFIDTEVENFTIRLDEDSDSGVDNADNKTNQTTDLQVSGSGEDGATVAVSEIKLDGVVIDLTGYTLVGSVVSGNWHIDLPDFTPDPPFGEGVYDVKVMMTDKAGNEKELTARFTIDLTPPVVEGGLKPADEDGENGSDSGPDSTDGVTNVPNPVLVGTVSEASRLVITITGGQTNVPAHTISEVNGAWEYQLPTLENGIYTWTVTATDLAGNQHSDTGTITIDRTPPDLSFAIDAEDITGGTNEHPLANLENETFVTFGGTVTLEQADTPIKVQFVIRNAQGGAVVDEEISVTNGERFTFEFTPPDDGTYTWDIIVTDLAGNQSTDDGIITIDTEVTPFANIEYADGVDTGSSATDGNTNNPRLSITGNTEGYANVQLIILDSGGNKVVDYSRSALEDGSFTITVPEAQKLQDPGVYTWTLTATDAAGNTLTTDPPVSFTFDNQAPVLTEIKLDEGTLGSSPDDLITKNKIPSFSGKTDDNATDITVTIVKLPNNENMGSDTVTPNAGVWTYTHATELLDGKYKAQIESIDLAGNRFYDEIEFTIDNTIRNDFELVSDYGIEGDQITNAEELVFKGTTDPDATLTFSMYHKEPDYFMQAFTPHINNETGEWEFTVEQLLPEGQYDFIFTTTDLAGNTNVSDPYTVTIDRSDPILLNVKLAPESDTDEQGDWSTETKAVKIIGTTEPGAFITVVIPDLNISYGPNETQQSVDPVTGEFWIQLPELNFGYYDILIVATDAAGNTATVSETLHIDSGFVPFTVGIADADDSGVKEDNVTSNTTPILTGNITPDYQLTLIIDGKRYPATISDRGVWEVEITPTLTEDKLYTVSFEIFDHNNAPVAQDNYSFTLDTSANVLVRLHQSSDSGDKNDFITNAHDIIVEFNADPGSKLKLYNVATNPPTLIDQTTVALSGRWNYEFNGLGEGEHNFKVEIEDPAGNTDYQEFDIKVDRIAPTFTDLSYGGKEYGPTLVFDAHSQTLTGRYTGDEAVTITLTNDGKNVAFTFNEHTGQFTANIVLKEGMNNLVLTITDEAGNATSYNTQVTAKTVMTFQMDVLDKNGNVDLDGEFSDDKITLKGVGYPGDILNISIVKKDGNTYTIPEFTVDETGNWTKQLTGLTDGEYTITVNIEDIAGNTDTRDPVKVILDTAYFDFTAKLDDSSGDTTDNLVNTSTPRFSGTGEAGTSIFVLVGGRTYTAATVTDGGVWTFNLPVELDEGESTITIWATDTAGNKSAESEFTVKVDTVIEAPTFTVTGVYVGDDGRHYINSKEGTNSHPTLSGSFSEQGTMTLAINGALHTAIYDLSDPDNTNNSWSFDVTGLPDGFTYNYTLTFTDLAGNTKAQNGMITVDKTINISYRIMEEYDSNLLDKVTNSREMGFNFTGTDADVTFNLSVTGPGNYTYERNDLPAVGDYVMEGSWETDGDYVFTFDFKDSAGNTWSQTFTIELDTKIDDLNAGDFSYDGEAFGIEDNIIYTNEETITIKYTPPPGAEYVRFEGKVDGMPGYPDGTQNGATGIWSIPSLNLVPGNNVINLFAWDLAGNDTVIQVEVFYIPDIGAVTLNIDGEAITNLDDPIPNLYSNEEDGLLTLSGTVAAGTEITITLNGIKLPSFEALESSNPLIPGEWSTTITLNEGPNTIKINMVDVAGNEKEIDFATILDTTDPIIMFDDDEGFVGEGYQLIDGVHTITGSDLDIKGLLDSGSSITGVTLNGGAVDDSDLIINGSKWELNLSGLIEGANTVIISAIDTAGNTIDKTININKDTSVTELELNRMPANDEVFNAEEAPRFSGTVEEGSQVFIHVTNVDTGMVESFPATVRDDGSFTAYVFDLEGGNYTWTIEAIDAAGNTLATPSVGAATGSFIIDDEVENFSVSYDGASLENGNMPAFSGTVEEGSKIVFTLTNEDAGGDYPCQVTVNGDNWSAIASNLPTGNYSWEITVTDPAGNVKTINSETNISVDVSVDNFQANLLDDGDGVVTALPTFSGSVEESSTVTILLVDKEDPNTTYTITATVTGTTWTANASTVVGGIPDGDYTWQATATDSLGNTSTLPSPAENLTIDTAPALPSELSFMPTDEEAQTESETTTETFPAYSTLSGAVDSGSSVVVKLVNKETGEKQDVDAIVEGETWRVSMPDLAEGNYSWEALSTDVAGNVSVIMTESNFTYEKPDEIRSDILEEQLHTTELSASKDLTDEIIESKVFSGKGEPESSVKITMGEHVYETQSDSDGDWVIKVNFDSPNTYDYQIEYVDAVGQAQKETGSVTVNKVQIMGDGVTSDDQDNIGSTQPNDKASSSSSEATTPNIDTMPDDQDNHY